MDELAKARGKGATSRLALLLARSTVSEEVSRSHPYRDMCYFSFPKGENGYRGAVSLEFGNGWDDSFQVRMYGGQENRLTDLGPVDFAAIKKAPDAATTAKWDDSRGDRPKATVGHVYLEHCLEPQDEINVVVKFKVLNLKPDAWVILEWEILGPPGGT